MKSSTSKMIIFWNDSETNNRTVRYKVKQRKKADEYYICIGQIDKLKFYYLSSIFFFKNVTSRSKDYKEWMYLVILTFSSKFL